MIPLTLLYIVMSQTFGPSFFVKHELSDPTISREERKKISKEHEEMKKNATGFQKEWNIFEDHIASCLYGKPEDDHYTKCKKHFDEKVRPVLIKRIMARYVVPSLKTIGTGEVEL